MFQSRTPACTDLSFGFKQSSSLLFIGMRARTCNRNRCNSHERVSKFPQLSLSLPPATLVHLYAHSRAAICALLLLARELARSTCVGLRRCWGHPVGKGFSPVGSRTSGSRLACDPVTTSPGFRTAAAAAADRQSKSHAAAAAADRQSKSHAAAAAADRQSKSHSTEDEEVLEEI
jgi:hypothetical protein